VFAQVGVSVIVGVIVGVYVNVGVKLVSTGADVAGTAVEIGGTTADVLVLGRSFTGVGVELQAARARMIDATRTMPIFSVDMAFLLLFLYQSTESM
jgi:hypothetical protein